MRMSFPHLLSRRDFYRVAGLSTGVLAVPLSGSSKAPGGQSDEETIIRSNPYLSIGINRKTGRAFVEEKISGEVWAWDWRDVRAADSASSIFSREAAENDMRRSPERLKPISPESIVPLPDGFQLRYDQTWGKFSCSVHLAEKDPEVIFQVQPDLRYRCELSAIQFPSTLRPESVPRPVFLDTITGGRMHRPSARLGKPLSEAASRFTVTADECWMRYWAVLGKKSAVMSILEPGFDAALNYFDDGQGALSFGWIHMPRLGWLDQARTQRFRFVASASYVAIARAYRQYAKQEGFFRSLRDKLEECPSLEKLFGAVLVMVGYLQDSEADYAGIFRKLKQRGVAKAYVYPVGFFNLNGGDELYPGYKWINLDREVLQELDRLGYLYAPWTWLNEILKGGPFFQEWLTLTRSDGSKSPSWKIGELDWYNSHEGRVLEILKQAAPELRAKYTAAHFDVLNAGTCMENYGAWSYDRKMNSQFRNAMFAQFSGHDRVVGSEQNKDWAIPYKHFGTNKLPGPYGKEAPFWPVPLWQLAFHDAVMMSWWEHSTYNDPDLGHDFSGREIRRRMLLDILTGDLPSVCPVGRMYGWKKPGSPDREIFVYQYKWDDPVTLRAVDAAVEVSRFNAVHATDDLIYHEFLSEDGQQQQTVYATGTQVKIRLPNPGATDDPGELKIS
jgi:hypothetical protein